MRIKIKYKGKGQRAMSSIQKQVFTGAIDMVKATQELWDVLKGFYTTSLEDGAITYDMEIEGSNTRVFLKVDNENVVHLHVEDAFGIGSVTRHYIAQKTLKDIGVSTKLNPQIQKEVKLLKKHRIAV